MYKCINVSGNIYTYIHRDKMNTPIEFAVGGRYTSSFPTLLSSLCYVDYFGKEKIFKIPEYTDEVWIYFFTNYYIP